MTTFSRAILAFLQLAPWNHEDWKEVQPRSGSAANAVEWTRVLLPARITMNHAPRMRQRVKIDFV